MSDYQEFTGKTVEEALRAAVEALAVGGLDDLDFEILTPGSRGVLGMGAEPARIVAAHRAALGGRTPKRSAAEAVPPPAQEERHGDGAPRPADQRDRRPPRDEGRRGGREDGGARGGGAVASEAPRRHEERPRRGDERRREGQRGGSALSDGEAAQVAAARASVATEREELQAAEATPEALATGKEILETILAHLGYAVTVTIEAGDTSKLNVTGEGSEKEALGALIGRKGERLSALQHLVNLILSRRIGEWTRILVDVEDYRGRRERQLREIALRAADRVETTGRMLQLEPMPALERRWIHLALRDRPGVATQSIGEEPDRRVVILRREP